MSSFFAAFILVLVGCTISVGGATSYSGISILGRVSFSFSLSLYEFFYTLEILTKRKYFILSEQLQDSWNKFLQKAYENTDKLGQSYTKMLYLLSFKFMKGFNENNLSEIIESLAETLPYLKKLAPRITCAPISDAYFKVVRQVEILLNEKPCGQKGFDEFNVYVQKTTAIVYPVIA